MDSMIIAVKIFFLLCCQISIISGSSSKQTNFRFHNGLNMKAQWAEIRKFKTESKIQCSMTCSLKDGCKSLTFHKKNKECVLYSAFKGNMTQKEDANVDYGEKIPVHKDCAGVKEAHPLAASGLVDIEICSGGLDQNSCTAVTVYCDMETLEGGWTVFQRRTDGSVNFRRYWKDYKAGFGHPSGEHWLGNDNLFHLTNSGSSQELLIELKEWEQNCLISTQYSDFSIASETEKYRLSVGNFMGGLAGDPMWVHDGMQFSTADQDNDMWEGGSCAIGYEKGAWWYNKCYRIDLNGNYTDKRCPGRNNGYIMLHLPAHLYYSFQQAEMKLRRADFKLADETQNSRWCEAVQTSCKCSHKRIGCI